MSVQKLNTKIINFHVLFIIGFLLFLVQFPPVVFTTSVQNRPTLEKLESLQKDCGLSDEGMSGIDDVRTRVPWNAAIFLRSRSSDPNSKLRFILTGTIVGPSAILILVGGAFGQGSTEGGNYFVWPPNRLLVGTGLTTTDLNHRDAHSQLSQVKFVVPFPSKASVFPEYHYILLHLTTPLNLTTPYVKPVCLPLEILDGDVSAELVQVWLKHTSGFSFPPTGGDAGSGSRSGTHELKELIVSPFPLSECEVKYSHYYDNQPYRPYCAIANTSVSEEGGKGQSCLLQGGSVAWRGHLGAVIGLVHHPPSSNGSCSKDTLYFYAGLLPALRWIHNNVLDMSLIANAIGFPTSHPSRDLDNAFQRCGHSKLTLIHWPTLCGPDGFSCSDGKCIKFSNVCDGVRQCVKSKEEDVNDYFNDENLTFCRAQNPCTRNRRKSKDKGQTHSCGVGENCIRPDQVCDGRVECSNGSDENVESCQVVK